MRRFSTTVVIALSTLLFVSVCAAQQISTTAVPNLIRYGGTLKDAQGAALSSSTAVGVTFAIYKQQDGGAAIWMETQNVTPDAKGQYSVLLGSTTAAGLPSDLFSQDEQRWLGVQVQGQPEQPRVLLVSVPYAFKAHEAETLGGKSISDFVLAKDVNSANSAAGGASSSGAGSTQVASGNGNNTSPSNLQPSMGQTFFSSSLTPVVSVMQTGTTPGNNAILATNSNLTSTSNAVTGQISGAGRAVYGQALSTSAQAYGVQGDTASTIGVGLLGFATATTGSTYGLKGYSSSTAGTGVRGLSTATTGTTYGVSGAVSSPNGTAMWGQATASNGGTGVWGQSQATTGAATGVLATAASTAGTGVVATESATSGTTYGLNAKVQSTAGTAAWLQNTAGGPLILATTGPSTSPVTKFSVDGGGNVNALGTFTGSGAGLTGIPFSNLGGTLASSQFSGTYSNAVTLSNTNNVYYGNGSNLTGIVGGGGGSPYYIQNVTAQQASSNFNISGSGSANTFNATTSYQIGGTSVLSLGSPADNLFLGTGAGASSNNANYNVFAGYEAGNSNTSGSENAFVGAVAGKYNTTGYGNTFVGFSAGEYTTTGYSNTFIGNGAGLVNTSGAQNTFIGVVAGSDNTTGSFNTFTGVGAGIYNTGGNYNTFAGESAGILNTTGSQNTFTGGGAGYGNTTGSDNTFYGYEAGVNSGNGNNNTFSGWWAGYYATGSSNTFYGAYAGVLSETGNNNIYIGNEGSETESNTIRIGGSLGLGYGEQTAAYIAGIYGSSVGGSGIAVYVDSNGQLGTVVSSRRFKEQIADMGDSTSRLFQLRPVTFFYKPQYDDGSHLLQYGLIAEEVAKVYPELVAYDKDGQPYTVKYQYLAPMLLNELQKQHAVAAAQQDVIKTQQEQIQTQGQQIADLQERLSRLESVIAKK